MPKLTDVKKINEGVKTTPKLTERHFAGKIAGN